MRRRKTHRTGRDEQSREDANRLRAKVQVKENQIFGTGLSKKQMRELDRAMHSMHGAKPGCSPAMEHTLKSQFDPSEDPEDVKAHYTSLRTVYPNPAGKTTTHFHTGTVRAASMGIVESITPVTKSFSTDLGGNLYILIPSFGQVYQDFSTVLTSVSTANQAFPDFGTTANWIGLEAPGIAPQARYKPTAATRATGFEYAQLRGLRITIMANGAALQQQGGFVYMMQSDGHSMAISTDAAWSAMKDSIFASVCSFENINTDIIGVVRPCQHAISNLTELPAKMWDGVTPFSTGPYGGTLKDGYVMIAIQGAAPSSGVEIKFEQEVAYFGGTIGGEIPVFIKPSLLACVETCRVFASDYKILIEGAKTESETSQVSGQYENALRALRKTSAHQSTFETISESAWKLLKEQGPAMLTRMAKWFL